MHRLALLLAPLVLLSACQSTTKTEDFFEARFARADVNKDGKLSREEVSDFVVHNIFDSRDANKDGKLTSTEWWPDNDAKQRAMFNKRDTNKDGFVSIAEREVSSAVAAVVCGTMPIMLAGFGAFTGERFAKREIVGLLIGFVGVAVMTSEALGQASGTAKILLLAPVGWALGSLLTKKLPQPPGLMSAAAQMLGGGLVSTLAALSLGERLPSGPLDSRSVLAFFYLVFVGSIVAFSAYSYLLRNARPSLATSYAYVNPGIAIVLGALLGGETITLSTVIGGGLVAFVRALLWWRLRSRSSSED